MPSKKLLVLFPGKRYSCELPLLYFAACIYRDAGFDVLNLTYPEGDFEGYPDSNIYEQFRKSVRRQMKAAEISSRSEAVFISKSMGTVIAGMMENEIGIPVRQIYLTPLAETFPFMKGRDNITAVLQGTADKWLEPKVLRNFCRRENLRLLTFPGAGHRLEIPHDMEHTMRNFRRAVKIYEEDIREHGNSCASRI